MKALRRWRASSGPSLTTIVPRELLRARLALGGRQEASCDARPPHPRLRLPRGRPWRVPGPTRYVEDPDRADLHERDRGLGAHDHPLVARGGPLWATPHDPDDGRPHGRRRSALRSDGRFLAPRGP